MMFVVRRVRSSAPVRPSRCTVSAAWEAEVEWRPDRCSEPTVDDAAGWAETARVFCALARNAIPAAGVDSDPPDKAGTGGNAAGTGAAP